MSKAYIDKGINDEETVYSINLLTEDELSIITSCVESFMNDLEEKCLDNVSADQEINNYLHDRFLKIVALHNKLKP